MFLMKALGKKMKKNNKGFTLIELIVVIAILGILAAVAIPRLSGFQDSAKKKTDISNARLIANNLNVAIADGVVTPVGTAWQAARAIPTTESGLGSALTAGDTITEANLKTLIVTKYMSGAAPATKFKPSGSFAISAPNASGEFTVTDGSVQLWPTPDSTYTN